MDQPDAPLLAIPLEKWEQLEDLTASLRARCARLLVEQKQLKGQLERTIAELDGMRILNEELEEKRLEADHFLVHRDRIRQKLDGLLSRLDVLELPEPIVAMLSDNAS